MISGLMPHLPPVPRAKPFAPAEAQTTPKPAPVPRGRNGGRRRRHPLAQVGDRFGDRVVVSVCDRDDTRNERVVVRCSRGHDVAVYAHNLRRKSTCGQCLHAVYEPAKPGDRFGGREILEHVANRCGHRRVLVLCHDCGRRYQCDETRLRRSKTCLRCKPRAPKPAFAPKKMCE